jgi:Amt family ammonium transporter
MVTATIAVGAVAERGRVMPAMVWTFLWATLAYCPIACWAWNTTGWGYLYGVMDYAGGGPVEIGSGMSALAYSMVLGRREEKMRFNFRLYNVFFILLGTVLLWFGWLGFNGGSSFGANLRATMACWNSCLAGNFAAASWVLLDFRLALQMDHGRLVLGHDLWPRRRHTRVRLHHAVGIRRARHRVQFCYKR